MKRYKKVLFYIIINLIFIAATFILVGQVQSLTENYGKLFIGYGEFLTVAPNDILGKKIYDGDDPKYVGGKTQDMTQFGCFYHNQASESDPDKESEKVAMTIHALYDIRLDDEKGMMKIHSYRDEAINNNVITGTDEKGNPIYLKETNDQLEVYADEKKIAFGEIVANASFRYANIKFVQHAIFKGNGHSVIHVAAIVNENNATQNGNGDKASDDEVNLCNDYRKMKTDSSTKPEKLTQDTTIDGKTYSVFGPFKTSFGGTGIESIEVGNVTWKKDSNSTDIQWKTDSTKWSSEFNGATKQGKITGEGSETADKQDTLPKTTKWHVPLSELTGEKFYLAVNKELLKTDVSEYNVKIVQETFEYREARIAFCQENVVKFNQQIGLYVNDDNISKVTGQASWTIENKKNGQITIEKVDKDNTSQKVQGVLLKIYAETDNGNGWLKADKTITTNYSSGATFATGINGTVALEEVPMGTYYIYEIGTPSGYKLEDQRGIYPNNKDTKGYAGKSDYGNAVYLGSLTLNGNSAELKGLTQARQRRKNNNRKSRQRLS